MTTQGWRGWTAATLVAAATLTAGCEITAGEGDFSFEFAAGEGHRYLDAVLRPAAPADGSRS